MKDADDEKIKGSGKKNNKKQVSNTKKSNKTFDDDEEKDEGKSSKKSNKSKEDVLGKAKKRDMENDKIEKIFESKLNVRTEVMEDQKKFVYKIIYNLNKKEASSLQMDKLWDEIKKASNYSQQCKDINILNDILISLDRESKIMFSSDTKEIMII
jgi:hypothetical protein